MRNKFTRILLLFSIVFGLATLASGQGIIVPGPCQRCPDLPRPIAPLPRALPIKSIKLTTTISSQVATTHVEQIFRNNTDATLEGTYFFPIPESASITEFAIWDGAVRLVGEVRPREEARRIYDEIVRRQRDPGLLEYAGLNLFQASIYPIPPRSEKKLEIKYTQVMRAENGTVSYRYPLGLGRQLTQIESVAGRIEIESSREGLRNIYSPTHAIDVNRSNYQRSVVSFESAGDKEPQDFQLFYTVSKEDFGLTLLTHREPGKQGYFLLMISPKEDWATQEYTAKDVIFVIDTSGSMAGEAKIEKARAALLYGVRILRPQDRFNIVSFAGEERLMEVGMIFADQKGTARGEAFVKDLKAVGGTNINQSLLTALGQFTDVDRERAKIVVFLTDGLPTVGITQPDRIIDNVRGAAKPGVRLFTFGVGYDVNTALLDKLAAENGGVADYIEPKENLEVKVSNFFARVNHPVLNDVQLDLGGVQTDLVYPRAIPDIFKGSQVTMIGRYSNESDLDKINITLTGISAGMSRTFTYENLRFPLRSEKNDYLPRLWATRRVGWLMEQVRTNGENQELRDEIVDLGTRYGIVTPYTSYLALENNNQSRNFAFTPGGLARDKAKSNVFSADSAATGTGAVASPTPSPQLPLVVTGEQAIRMSKATREQQDASRLKLDERLTSMRRAGGKTFYLVDGVWIDAEFKAESKLEETTVTFGSDEYYALLRKNTKLGSYFSLGERVVVVFEGRVYRVNAPAP
jgi:Ca-activated chloride channel homolog